MRAPSNTATLSTLRLSLSPSIYSGFFHSSSLRLVRSIANSPSHGFRQDIEVRQDITPHASHLGYHSGSYGPAWRLGMCTFLLGLICFAFHVFGASSFVVDHGMLGCWPWSACTSSDFDHTSGKPVNSTLDDNLRLGIHGCGRIYL